MPSALLALTIAAVVGLVVVAFDGVDEAPASRLARRRLWLASTPPDEAAKADWRLEHEACAASSSGGARRPTAPYGDGGGIARTARRRARARPPRGAMPGGGESPLAPAAVVALYARTIERRAART